MSDFDLRRRTFLGLLGLAGAAAVITPAQEVLLSEPIPDAVDRPTAIPMQGELWAKLTSGWTRLGDLVNIAVDYPHSDDIVTVDVLYGERTIRGIHEPPTANLTVSGWSDGIVSLIKDRGQFEARAYLADVEIVMPRVFVSQFTVSVSAHESANIDLSFQASGNGIAMNHWKRGMRLA